MNESPAKNIPNFASVGPGIYTAGQPWKEDFAGLYSSGIRRIVDLRPEDEDRGFNEAEEARRARIAYRRLLIKGASDLTLARVRELDELLLGSEERPTFVHCASSNRVGALMALRAAWLQGQSADSVLALGRSIGLRELEPAVRAALAATAASPSN
jgi:protein tyrosine phosphatase (PTP) superfamily phosphohydrolase (DUF442 family)